MLIFHTQMMQKGKKVTGNSSICTIKFPAAYSIITLKIFIPLPAFIPSLTIKTARSLQQFSYSTHENGKKKK